MREQREFPTFREWLGGPIAEELTDDDLERFRQESLKGAVYDLRKASFDLMCVTVFPFFDAAIGGFSRVWRTVGRVIGLRW